MKKRVLAALAAAVLLATASAASADGYVTLAELSKQAAEEGWHQVYEVDGKTLVTDAGIRLPSADTCPILRIEPLGRDEGDSVFDAYRAQKNAQIAADDKGLTVEVINDESRLPVAREDWGTNVVQPSDFYDGEIGPQSTPENVDLTYDELLKRIDGALESLLAVSLSDFQIDTVQVSQPAYEQETGRPLTKMGQYTVTATQLFHGIPLLDGAAHDRPNGQMIYGYSCPDCYSFTFACSKETGVQEEDVPLLPFDAIKAKGQALIDAGADLRLRGLQTGRRVGGVPRVANPRRLCRNRRRRGTARLRIRLQRADGRNAGYEGRGVCHAERAHVGRREQVIPMKRGRNAPAFAMLERKMEKSGRKRGRDSL